MISFDSKFSAKIASILLRKSTPNSYKIVSLSLQWPFIWYIHSQSIQRSCNQNGKDSNRQDNSSDLFCLIFCFERFGYTFTLCHLLYQPKKYIFRLCVNIGKVTVQATGCKRSTQVRQASLSRNILLLSAVTERVLSMPITK